MAEPVHVTLAGQQMPVEKAYEHMDHTIVERLGPLHAKRHTDAEDAQKFVDAYLAEHQRVHGAAFTGQPYEKKPHA